MFDSLVAYAITFIGIFIIIAKFVSALLSDKLDRDDRDAVIQVEHKNQMRTHDFVVQMRKVHIKDHPYELTNNIGRKSIEMRVTGQVIAIATYEELLEKPFEIEKAFVLAIEQNPPIPS